MAVQGRLAPAGSDCQEWLRQTRNSRDANIVVHAWEPPGGTPDLWHSSPSGAMTPGEMLELQGGAAHLLRPKQGCQFLVHASSIFASVASLMVQRGEWNPLNHMRIYDGPPQRLPGPSQLPWSTFA